MAFSKRESRTTANLAKTDSSSSSNSSEPNNYQDLEIFCKSLGIKSSSIITCHQVHGDHITICGDVPEKIVSADAIIATKPGLYPLIRTADCVPVLVIDHEKRIAAAIHAGWRGTVLRIVRKTLLTLRDKFKCDIGKMIATLGPSIGKCCYEVDQTVLNPLLENLPWANEFVFPSQDTLLNNNGKRKLDLAAINHSELVKSGIPEKNIYEINMCTYCNPDALHSFRRDGESSGRSMALTGFRL